MVKRALNILNILAQDRSAFLFGARGVGKTFLAHEFLQSSENVLTIDLLDSDTFNRYLLNPGLFRADVEEKLKTAKHLSILVDEVQKLPGILDSVHLLIENHKKQLQFLLTGSSARKLKKGGANLLGGRALTLKLYPFSSCEVDINLNRVLQFGSLPAYYIRENLPIRELKSYVETYLQEEIRQEAIVRRYEGFVRFLELAAQMNSEPINFSQIARSAHVHQGTVQDYFSILEDTLLVHRLNAWTYSVKKQLRQSPKFYFFDCGILNALRGELGTELKTGSFRYGKLFETFIVQELFRYNDYYEADYKFHYWRTSTGTEVDIILSHGPNNPPIAIEIKSNPNPFEADLKALNAFASENKNAKLICLCTTPNAYSVGDISVLPWKEGLNTLYLKP